MPYRHFEQWKRRFLACIAAALCAFCLTGAREVTAELRNELLGHDSEKPHLRNWTRKLLDETGVDLDNISLTAEQDITILQAFTAHTSRRDSDRP